MIASLGKTLEVIRDFNGRRIQFDLGIVSWLLDQPIFSFPRHNAKSKNLLSRIAIGKANERHKKQILDNPVLYQIRDNFHIKLETSGRLSFIGLAISPNRARRCT
jgi:hypothetical protein